MADPVRDVGVDPRLVYALFGVGVALAVAVVIAADLEETGRAEPGAYLFAVGFGALMLGSRRAPRGVLALTVLGVFAYYFFEYPPIGIALPAVAALYAAAEAGRALWAVAASGVLVSVAAVALINEGRPVDFVISYEVLTNVALVATAIALGVSVRARREAREHLQRLHRLSVLDQARQAEHRLQEERIRIARDLHDLVGHTLSVIAVHNNVAAEAIGSDDAAARRAVRLIGETTSTTMRDLRATVRVLRSPETDADRQATGLCAVPALVRAAADAGLDIDLELDLPGGGLDGAVDAAGYRIVQESLTNVIRHAGATRAQVQASVHGDVLRLVVRDDGSGAAGGLRAGAGLLGMQERAAVLGGRVWFGAAEEGRGFAVHAELPVRVGR